MEHLSRRQKREIAQQRSDMEGMLASPFGRRFLMRMIHDTGVYSLNTDLSGVREGMRRVGLTLIDDIMSVDPAAYARLMAEAVALAAKTKTDDDNQPTGDHSHDTE